MAEPFVAAVDGGGSKTAVAVATRDGSARRLPTVGGSNPQDNPDWAQAIEAALAPVQGAAHVVLGLGGYGEVPEVDARLEDKARALTGPRFTMMNDVALAARAAFPNGGGVLVLSGTGSMAVATGPAGTVRVGGWGDLFSDEGSAFWIGREALARAARERDGREGDTRLADGLEAALGLTGGGHYALLGWALAQPHPRADIARLARIVDRLAGNGVDAARALLDAAAGELAALAATAARRAGLEAPQPWAPAGSVFNSRILTGAVAARLGGPAIAPAADALGGGLLLAARAAGWDVDAAWRARVAAGLTG
ncbi:MAG: N-acetylglucosamine kinase [Rubellimicrobium sp.]|nr:N-acetylglucosamine kinase [Rubellimicrobium sp.]